VYPQHDEQTAQIANGVAAQAARRKEKRNVALATATGLLALALAGGGLALSVVERGEAQVSPTRTAITAQRPSAQAARPSATALAAGEKSIVERIIERVIIREPAPKIATPVTTVTPEDPQDQQATAIAAAKNALAAFLGVGVADIFFSSIEQVDFGNQCLDVIQPNQVCAQVVTPGYRIKLVHDDTIYSYHTWIGGPYLVLADQQRVNPSTITTVTHRLSSPHDGSEVVGGIDDAGRTMIVRYALDGSEYQLFAEHGYSLGDVVFSDREPYLAVRIESIGDGLLASGVYLISLDGGQFFQLQADTPALRYRPLSFSPLSEHVLLAADHSQANPSCQLMLHSLLSGTTMDLSVQTAYPGPATACESYGWSSGPSLLDFDILAYDQQGYGLVVESWQLDSQTGALTLASANGEEPVVEEDRFALLGVSEDVVVGFLHHLQGLVASDDREQLAQWVVYPLGVTIDGADTTIYSPEEFVANYDAIMHEGVRGALLNQSPDQLFVNDQGVMIGQGEIWISPTDPGLIQIIGINN
jgi:hypothetical protein